MRNIVKNTFTSLNIPCEFIEAANGNEALLRLSENEIALVLLDWNMPQLSGIDFLKKIRAMPQYADLPVIMVTSEAARYNVIEALKSGATDYIIKPVSEKSFKENLSKDKKNLTNLLFSPGFSTASKTDHNAGRGVGLHLVKERLKEIGGTLKLKSENGKGTLFAITIPLS
jgi:two-component system chemotaxis response regulator CheY